MSAVTKLKILLDEKVALLAEKQGQLNRLAETTQSLKSQIEGIQEALKAVEAEPVDTVVPTHKGHEPGGTLTSTILKIIESNGTSPGLLPSEIVDTLIKQGMNKDRRQLYATVYPICVNLAKKGRIKESSKQGKKSFMRNQPV